MAWWHSKTAKSLEDKYVFKSVNLAMFVNYFNLYQTIVDYLGEEKLQTFINFALGYMSKIQLPVKRGNFVEFRTGMINISPVGRSCSKIERDEFEEYDKIHDIRKKFIESIKENLPDIGLTYSIGEYCYWPADCSAMSTVIMTQTLLLLFRWPNKFRLFPHWLGQTVLSALR